MVVAVPTTSAAPTGQGGRHGGGREKVFELTLTQTGGTAEPTDTSPAGTLFTEYGTAALTKTGAAFGTWGYQGVVLDNESGTLQTQAVGTFDTPLGQITAQGLNSRDTLENAIPGGTKTFRRATGYIAISSTGETVTMHVFLP